MYRRKRRVNPFLRRKYRGNRALLWGVLAIVIATAMIFVVDSKLRPIMTDMAIARAKYTAIQVINESISTELSKQDQTYENLIILVQDEENKVSALRTDIMKINSLKSKILATVVDGLKDMDKMVIYIPLGNILNGDVFSGKGPAIPIKVVPVGTANAAFISEFTAAGINQTRHQILMEVSAQIYTLLPGRTVATEVVTQVVVSETILVGTVPESYTYIDDTESSLLGRINDYARQQENR